jgi:hypothetical protein
MRRKQIDKSEIVFQLVISADREYIVFAIIPGNTAMVELQAGRLVMLAQSRHCADPFISLALAMDS